MREIAEMVRKIERIGGMKKVHIYGRQILRRLLYRLSLSEIARRVGCSVGYLSFVASGKRDVGIFVYLRIWELSRRIDLGEE